MILPEHNARFGKWSRLVMAVALALLGLVPAGVAQAAPGDCATNGSQVTCTFAYTGGAQTWTVPPA